MSKDLQKLDKNGLAKSKTGKLDLTKINIEALKNSLTIFTPPRLFYQLVVFVLDGSGSMTYPGMSGRSKGEEIENSVKQVIDRLLKSKNKNSFDINIWAYANESKKVLGTTTVTDINLNISVNPTEYIDLYDRTKLHETLKNVSNEVKDYLETYKEKNSQALVIILSDGAIHDQEESQSIFNETNRNEKITFSSVLFESKLWKEKYNEEKLRFLKDNLGALASSPSLFKSSLDPEEIRKHMIKSISTVSKID